MKWFMRGFIAAVFCVGMLGVMGCGSDNDTEASNLAKSAGDPGKPSEKGVPTNLEASPKSSAEAYERQKKQQEEMFKKGYPTKK
jgi:hypothetical protein